MEILKKLSIDLCWFDCLVELSIIHIGVSHEKVMTRVCCIYSLNVIK